MEDFAYDYGTTVPDADTNSVNVAPDTSRAYETESQDSLSRDALQVYLQQIKLHHPLQVYLKSVFLVVLAPVRLNLVTAGLEYLPKLPTPRASPLFLALYLLPLLKELALPFLF